MENKEIVRRIDEDNNKRERVIWAVVDAVRSRQAEVPPDDFVKAFLAGEEPANVLWWRRNWVEYLVRAVEVNDEIGFEIYVTTFGDEETDIVRYDFPRNLSCMIEEYIWPRSQMLAAIEKKWHIN